ncbi:rhamnulokinase family protein [Nonomuraea sp. NPDC046570]|uniref:rhamnulokinase n=1 Tax=Nonomuraea sp. NPDC046570 TaxID=3155255 RepID=UPI0033F314EC
MRFTAVDLGASSGRVMVAEVGPGTIDLTEAHRFANRPVRVGGTLHWDILGLYRGVLDGLRAAGPSASIGIDSWGVDYGLLDERGALLGNPVHHRDERTDGAVARLAELIGDEELYQVNGLQFLPINTIYQLLADPPRAASTLLMIPDLLTYWLTGSIGAEPTNASTTGLFDVRKRAWSHPLMSRLGLPAHLFPELRPPGTPAGPLRPDVAAETGYGAAVTVVASHDTASAVAAVPATTDRFAYISCGTWSLVGVELPEPLLGADGRAANFTNEAGIDGTTRYLRNVMGLWILQECLREWGESDLEGLLRAAGDAEPFQAVIDAGDPVFLAPGGMPGRVAEYCARTGQPVPEGRAQAVRCVLESLALAYRKAVSDAARLSGKEIEVVHVVGGGARNALLCRLTADATGLPVVAGPVEAAALGNVLVQARAHGLADDPRELVRRASTLRTFHPSGGQGPWAAMAARLPGAAG